MSYKREFLPPYSAEPVTSVAIVNVENAQFLIPTNTLKEHSRVCREKIQGSRALFTVHIEDIDIETFQLIEYFFRVGKPPRVTVQNVIDLYCAAFNLGLQKLARACHEKIMNSGKVEQALIYYVEADRHNMAEERREIVKRLGKLFKKVALSEGVVHLSEKQLINLIQSKGVEERPPRERICAALRWLQADCKMRRKSAERVIRALIFDDADLDGIRICPEIAKRVPRLKKYLWRASSEDDDARSKKTKRTEGSKAPQNEGVAGKKDSPQPEGQVPDKKSPSIPEGPTKARQGRKKKRPKDPLLLAPSISEPSSRGSTKRPKRGQMSKLDELKKRSDLRPIAEPAKSPDSSPGNVYHGRTFKDATCKPPAVCEKRKPPKVDGESKKRGHRTKETASQRRAAEAATEAESKKGDKEKPKSSTKRQILAASTGGAPEAPEAGVDLARDANAMADPVLDAALAGPRDPPESKDRVPSDSGLKPLPETKAAQASAKSPQEERARRSRRDGKSKSSRREDRSRRSRRNAPSGKSRKEHRSRGSRRSRKSKNEQKSRKSRREGLSRRSKKEHRSRRSENGGRSRRSRKEHRSRRSEREGRSRRSRNEHQSRRSRSEGLNRKSRKGDRSGISRRDAKRGDLANQSG